MFLVTRNVVIGFARVYFRLTVMGTEKLPDGPFILSPIHRSNLDSPLRDGHHTEADAVHGQGLAVAPEATRRFLYAIGGFPVARGSAGPRIDADRHGDVGERRDRW